MPYPAMTPEQQRAYDEALEKIEAVHRTRDTTLSLHNNQLSTLPPEIGQLTALRSSLHDNQLTTLPPEIGPLAALRTLYLTGNQLTTLPPEIGPLTA